MLLDSQPALIDLFAAYFTGCKLIRCAVLIALTGHESDAVRSLTNKQNDDDDYCY